MTVNVVFPDLISISPYSDDGDVLSLKVCGTTIAEHIVAAVRRRYPGHALAIDNQNKKLVPEKLWRFISTGNTQTDDTAVQEKGDRYVTRDGRDVVVVMPWHLLDLMEGILQDCTHTRSDDVDIHHTASVDEHVTIGKGTKICQGAIVQGDVYLGNNCLIGYNSVIRGPCVIEDDCRIGYSVEVKNTWLQPGTIIGPLSFIGDSVVGAECFLGALTRTSNVRLDFQNVHYLIDGKLTDTGRRRLGCFIGHRVRTGVGVVVLPGRMIGNDVLVGPKVLVSNNLESGYQYQLKQEIIRERFDYS